jgi:pimeloyl-ACP methyl ester carboxylesterase
VTVQTEIAIIDGHPIEYRRAGPGPQVALILHGGHMSAACRFGEETYLDAGLGVLTVSRPGYGRTAASAGPSAPEFVARLARLLADLRLEVAVAVGISLGARSALTLAACYPALVPRVILLCPVSFRPWPVGRTRRVARIAFHPAVQGLTWGAVHALLRRDPDRYLPRVVGDLSTLPGTEVVERLGPDRAATVEFLLSCRSDRGFTIDLRPPTDVTDDVRQPVLVLASRRDGSVGMEHPEHLAASLADARLVEVGTPSHLLWLGEGADETRSAIREFVG